MRSEEQKDLPGQQSVILYDAGRVTPLAFIFQFHSPQGRSLKLCKVPGAANGRTGEINGREFTGNSQRGRRELGEAGAAEDVQAKEES